VNLELRRAKEKAMTSAWEGLAWIVYCIQGHGGNAELVET
jgi:hypothetical protein